MPLSCLVSFHAVAAAAGWSGVPARDVVLLDLLPCLRRPVDKSFLDAMSAASDAARDEVLETSPLIEG